MQARCVRHLIPLLVLAVAATAAPAAAQDEVRVAALQLPAWVERGGARQALRPGMTLAAGDVVATGPKARLYLDMPDGSLVKLGEQARLDLAALGIERDEAGEVVSGALRVLKGAFRFTTRALGTSRRRNLSISVGVVTAGVRGTDIWGKSDDEKDLVCLLEGRITVASAGAPEQEMAGTNLFYVVPRGQAPQPIAPADPAKIVNEWAPQTETHPGQGVVDGAGPWKVVLASHPEEARAAALVAQLDAAGYPAEVAPREVRGRTWYRVRITGFATQADARALAQQIEGQFDIFGAWVTR